MNRILICMAFFLLHRVSHAQNTGIGTTLPASTLDVNGSLSIKVTTITGSATLTSTDAVVLCNSGSPITVTLPTAVGITGRIYTIKNINTGSVTIVCSSGQTIDGLSSGSLSTQYAFIQLVSNGSNWNILDEDAPGTLVYTFATDQSVGNGDFIGIGSSSSTFVRNSIVCPFDCELTSITLSTRVLTTQPNVTATIWVNSNATALSTTMNGTTTIWSSTGGSHFVIKGDLISIKLTTSGGALSNGVTATVTVR